MNGNIYLASTFNFVLPSLRHERGFFETKKYSHELFNTKSSMLLHAANYCGF